MNELVQNEDISKSNTLYQFVNLAEKEKFVHFKVLKTKQENIGKRLKTMLKITTSGTSKVSLINFQNYTI